MNDGNENRSHGGVETHPVGHLVLTMDLVTFQLAVKGNVPTLEMALAILAQATRFFETQLRMQAVQQVQEQRAAAQLTQEILGNLRHKG